MLDKRSRSPRYPVYRKEFSPTILAHDIYAKVVMPDEFNMLVNTLWIGGPATANAGDEVRVVLQKPELPGLVLRDLVQSGTFQWTASGSGTNEYYLETDGGGDPGIAQPNVVYFDGTAAPNGTPGSLSAGQWGWGDNDSNGWNSLYVRLSDGADPDSKADGFVQKDWKNYGDLSVWVSTNHQHNWSQPIPSDWGVSEGDILRIEINNRVTSDIGLTLMPEGV